MTIFWLRFDQTSELLTLTLGKRVNKAISQICLAECEVSQQGAEKNAVVDKNEPTKNRKKDTAETSGARGDENGINYIAFGNILSTVFLSFQFSSEIELTNFLILIYRA